MAAQVTLEIIAMKTNITPDAFRIAAYPTLCLSWFVLLGMGGLKNALKFIASCPIQMTVGCAVMILIIESVGIHQRARLYHFGAGMLFASFLFLAGILWGFASSMFVYGDFDLNQYVFGPLFFFSICGVLPAAVFGAIGTAALRMTRKGMQLRATHFKP
jgi:hypothetical protein